MITRKLYPSLKEFLLLADQADQPDYKMRNTAQFYDVLKRPIRVNLRLLGHYQTRLTALQSFDYTITAADPASQIRADEALIRNRVSIDFLIANHLQTVFYGCSCFQIKYNPNGDESRVTIQRLLDNTEYDYDDHNLVFRSQVRGGKQVINLIDTRSTDEYLFDRLTSLPFRGGIMRVLMPTELIGFDMLLENANYLRKLKGILQIINRGGSAEEQAAAELAAASAVQHNYLLTDDMIELKLNTITTSAGSSFKEFRDEINKTIAIGILGQANTSDLPNGGGSRAALQVQKMITADILYSDMIRTESLVNRFLMLDYKANYNDTAMPYQFRFKLAEEQDREANANALETIIRTGIPLDTNEVYSFIGFKKPAPENVFNPIL